MYTEKSMAAAAQNFVQNVEQNLMRGLDRTPVQDAMQDNMQDAAQDADMIAEQRCDRNGDQNDCRDCRDCEGRLPGECGPMVFPFVAMQQRNPKRYGQKEALQQGTLFPGLNLPFHRELRSRFPAANTPLSELMALDFAIDELGLYLVTHADDQDALNLYWSYIKLAKEGRERYTATYGPLQQTDITEGGFKWLNDPWPWDEGGND